MITRASRHNVNEYMITFRLLVALDKSRDSIKVRGRLVRSRKSQDLEVSCLGYFEDELLSVEELVQAKLVGFSSCRLLFGERSLRELLGVPLNGFRKCWVLDTESLLYGRYLKQ